MPEYINGVQSGGSSTGSGISTDTSSFNNNLSAADDTVQKALDTLDNTAGGGGANLSYTTASGVVVSDSGTNATIDVMSGDAGAGGTRGLVPDQAIGDAAKFLRGDGTWGDGGGNSIYSADDQLAGARVVDMNGNTLEFSNNSGLTMSNGANNHTFTSSTHAMTRAAASGNPFITVNDGTGVVGEYFNSGTPEGAVTAGIGSLYRDYTNGKLYIKETGAGNTGWVEIGSGSGITNLSVGTTTATTVDIDSDTGTNATIPAATGSVAGLLSATDKTKMDFVSVTQAVDLDTIESDTATNNAKVGYTDAAVIAAPITGFTSGAGTVAATDTILESIQKLDGNVAAINQEGTDLGYTAAPTNGTVTNDTGTDATLTLADATNAGLMAPADFTKLGAVEALADVTDATNVAAAGALMDTDVAAKGDLFVGTANDSYAILTAGSNGQALVADSTQGTGLRWATGGGMTGGGDITADPAPAAANTIYTIDASGGAFNVTLPASTGSQTRIILLTKDVATNNATVVVPSGEDLNDVTNAVYSLSTNGQQLLITDRATGKWDIALIGTGSETSLDMVRMRRAAAQSITSSVDVDIDYDTEDYDTGNIADTGTGIVTIAKAGTYRITSGWATSAGSNNAQSYIKVNGTKIARAMDTQTTSGSIDGLNCTTTQQLSVGDTVRGGVFSSTSDNTNTGLVDQPFLEVIQLPTTESVPAGAIIPTSLSYVSFGSTNQDANIASVTTTIGSGYKSVDLADADLNQIIDTDSLVNVTDNSITIARAGKYEFTFGTSCDINSYDEDIAIYVDGAMKARTYNVQNADARALQSISVILDLTVGQKVEFGWDADVAIPFMNPWGTVKELPTSSVVNPGSITPSALHRVSLSSSVSGAVIDNPSSLLDLDDTDFDTSYDPQGLIDTTNNRITVTNAGDYKVTVSAVSAGTDILYIRKNGTRVQATTNDASSTRSASLVIGMSAADYFDFEASGNMSEVSITVEQLPTSTIVEPDAVTVNDQSSSGYMDIGNMRMAWGKTLTVGDTDQVVPFGVTFASAPMVQAGTDNGTATNNAHGCGVSTITTTGFTGNRDDALADGDNAYFNWFAVGQKP